MENLDQQKILTYLRDNKAFLQEEFGVSKIALFGSFARNEADETSDVNLLIKCNRVCIENTNYLQVPSRTS